MTKNARFAKTSALRDLLAPEHGVYLGRAGWRRRDLLSDAPEHTVVVAPTRAGKGVGVLVQNALAWPGSALILDPKGEFRRLTQYWRAQYTTCYTWGPTTFGTRWNPLAEIAAAPPDQRTEKAVTLARVFGAAANPGRSNADPFWNSLGQSFLAHALLWAATARDTPGTLAHVYALCCSDDKLARLLESLRDDETALGQWARAHLSKTPGVASSTVETARSWLTSLSSTAVCDATAAAEMTYDDLLAGQTTCYLTANALDFSTHGRLLTAFLEGYIARLLEREDALSGPLLLLLDEFALLPALPSLEVLLTLSAGYGVRLLIVLQSLSQVDERVRNILLANCHNQLFFSATDPVTCDHLSKRTGKVYRTAKSRSRGKHGTSVNTAERQEDLLAPHEIRSMRKALLFHGRIDPARVALVPYFKDKRFQNRLGDVMPPTPSEHAPVPFETLLPPTDEDATPPTEPAPSPHIDDAIAKLLGDHFDELDDDEDDEADEDPDQDDDAEGIGS